MTLLDSKSFESFESLSQPPKSLRLPVNKMIQCWQIFTVTAWVQQVAAEDAHGRHRRFHHAFSQSNQIPVRGYGQLGGMIFSSHPDEIGEQDKVGAIFA